MTNPLRLGIAGLGTVGVGVLRMIAAQTASGLLQARTGRKIEVVAVSARSRDKDRGVNLARYAWEDDPVTLAQREDVDVFVELMGGSEGAARAATQAALSAGKHVVTANKALLAIHGQALAEAAEAAGVSLNYEAAVAGGIPAIKALRESLAGNEITRVMGVMNGTCNYILTRMQESRQGYNALFEECGRLGYLEADPTLDVGGIDAGHKLALLAAIAFGTQVDFENVHLEGIQDITLEDIDQAADMGYRIKLLGVAQLTGRGLEQRMTPCLVPQTAPLAQLEGGTNMVVFEGSSVGSIVLRGAGAGEGPTASAVMGDVCDIARGVVVPTFGCPARMLTAAPPARSLAPAPYYMRLTLLDRPGALARVAAVLGDSGISIDRMRQYAHQDNTAPVLIVTHKITHDALQQAVEALGKVEAVAKPPVTLRIEAV